MNPRNPDSRFEVKLGRMRTASGHARVTGFLKKVGRRGLKRRAAGGGLQRRSAVRAFQRRVMVKVSIVRMDGRGIGAQRQHLKYIQRDSAAPGEEGGALYDRDGRDIDVKAFEAGGRDDRHQFRIIVSPEDSAQLFDLSAFTRDLVSEMEKDLGTRLEWVAADHYDTGQPHTHIVMRGKRDDGTDLVMPKDYVSRGIRVRAQELVQIELGPVPQIEGRNRFAAMVRQVRLTELDHALMRGAKDRIVDLSEPVRRGQLWRRQLERARLKHLSEMELAEPLGKGRWRLADGAGETLKRMGERGDIIKTMHQAMKTHGLRRIDASSFFDPSAENAIPVTGKIISLGVANDVADRAFIVIDRLEGRTAYVDIGPAERLSDLNTGQVVTIVPPRLEPRASDHVIEKIAARHNGRYGPSLHMQDDPKARPEYVQAHIRRLEALRRAGHVSRHRDGSWTIPRDYLERAADYERASALSRPVETQMVSSLKLSEMRNALGATWLDQHLLDGESLNQPQGFGAAVEEAKAARRRFLVQQGILKQISGPVTQETLDELSRRDLAKAGTEMSGQIGKPYAPAPSSGRVSGTYTQSVDRPSGRFAVIERSKDFTLVPWRDVLERAHGKSVSGLIRGNAISWRFGKRLGISK